MTYPANTTDKQDSSKIINNIERILMLLIQYEVEVIEVMIWRPYPKLGFDEIEITGGNTCALPRLPRNERNSPKVVKT